MEETMCLHVAITLLLANVWLVGCAQDTIVCREQISTNKGRKFLVTISNFDSISNFTGMLYIGSHTSGSVNITKHIDSSSSTDVRKISPGINEISISPSNLTNLVQTTEGKQTKVLRIESTVDIAVYMTGYIYGVAAGYTVFPLKAWSTKYVVPSFKPYRYRNVAIISSFQQDTFLQISDTKLKNTINATINADESYLMVESSDISGTVVQSNIPVSLVSQCQNARVPEHTAYGDPLLDSPVPVEYWETEFIVPPLTPELGYFVRVFAQDSNDTVKIMVKNRTHTINQTFTGMYEALFGTDAIVITTDKKVSVVQYGLGNDYDDIYSDPFMTSVPAVHHYDNDYLIPTPFASDGFINTIAITIRQKHISGLLMDGQPVGLQSAKTITPVQPYDDFRILSLNLTSGNHNLTHPSCDAAFSVLLYGRTFYSGFGFYLGYSFDKDVKLCENGGICSDSTICQCQGGYTGERCQFALSQPVCFSCDYTDDLSFCDNIEQCSRNQTCYLQRFTNTHGHTHYRSGCTDRQTCYQHEHNDYSDDTCVHCCEGDFCNSHGCGDNGFPPRETRGPLCLDCTHVSHPNECDQITICSSDEMCRIEELPWGENSIYHLGCASVHDCAVEAGSLGKRSQKSLSPRSVPICTDCCNGDFCNRNCTYKGHHHQQIIIG